MSRELLQADVAVVGLGAIGSAVLYQLARRGVRVVGFDRYPVPHAFGSSHGETRITRQAVGEGAAYVPLVQNSHRIWREIEHETGEKLLRTTGNLIVSSGTSGALHHGKPDFVRRSADIARSSGIPHEVLEGCVVRARFPHLVGVRDEDIGYFEPGAGYLHPEKCIASQLSLAKRHGAAIAPPTEILAITQERNSVVCHAAGLTIRADRVVVASGAWTGPLVGGEFADRLQVYRQVLHWFGLTEDADIDDGAPTFIWMHGDSEEDYFYGFPPLPGENQIKVATEQYGRFTSADHVARAVEPREREAMYQTHLAGRIAGIQANASKSVACLYTVTPDRGFIIDRHPELDRVLVVSACSGHGFKHSAGIGEAVAQTIVDGRSDVDLSPFRLSRFREPLPRDGAVESRLARA